jgi:hypothetical protein
MGLAHAANLKLGVVTTGDSLDWTKKDMALMMSEGASVKEMEAAAVAWVCSNASIPFAAIKSITYIVDDSCGQIDINHGEFNGTREMFENNFDCAISSLKEKIENVLKLLDHVKLSTLSRIGPYQ